MSEGGARILTNNSRIIQPELSFRLQGIFISVSQQYGHLYKEKLYENACKEHFEEANIHFVS